MWPPGHTRSVVGSEVPRSCRCASVEPVSPRTVKRHGVVDGLNRVSWCTIGHRHDTHVGYQKRWQCTWRCHKSRGGGGCSSGRKRGLALRSLARVAEPTQTRIQSLNSSEGLRSTMLACSAAKFSPSFCLVRRQGAATTSLLRRRW